MSGFVCGVCLEPLVFTEHEDGRSWTCPCGRASGAIIDRGRLDLGIVRADSPGENRLDVFYETFENIETEQES